jgi:hypothetical protein
MTDRELLELAAKAAGIEVWFPRMNGGRNPDGSRIILEPCHTEQNGFVEEWNPLTDDGDALRLAVKLEMTVYVPQPKTAKYNNAGCQNHEATIEALEPAGDDPYAATRRAIVRAAAEIGKD